MKIGKNTSPLFERTSLFNPVHWPKTSGLVKKPVRGNENVFFSFEPRHAQD